MWWLRYLPYEVRVHELAENHELPWNGVHLASLPVDHSVPCLAYRLDLSRDRRFDPDKARAFDVPIGDWKSLQRGETVLVNDRLITPDQVLGPERRGLSLAYVTDTRPTPRMPEFLANVDLLTIEGTYGDPADAENAIENKHMLFSEAAEIGRLAGVRQIWLTHFSAKMLYPERYLDEATRLHPATSIGFEGLTTTLRYSDA
jgi:ribonuclease Z